MIVVLSPSKSMTTFPVHPGATTQPSYLTQSSELMAALRGYTTEQLMDFMGISEKLAVLNMTRFANWSQPFTPNNARQAVYAFSGDVYDGLEADSLTAPGITFAQNHLRILSGLYGLLKPLDLIQPYRLEMGKPLKTKAASNLYDYWRETLTAALNDMPGELLVNLASQEYFKAIDPKRLNKHVVSPIFKDEKNGRFKIISFYAKKARGTMARYILQNQITKARDLRTFTDDGYYYSHAQSTDAAPLFLRNEKQV